MTKIAAEPSGCVFGRQLRITSEAIGLIIQGSLCPETWKIRLHDELMECQVRFEQKWIRRSHRALKGNEMTVVRKMQAAVLDRC